MIQILKQKEALQLSASGSLVLALAGPLCFTGSSWGTAYEGLQESAKLGEL